LHIGISIIISLSVGPKVLDNICINLLIMFIYHPSISGVHRNIRPVIGKIGLDMMILIIIIQAHAFNIIYLYITKLSSSWQFSSIITVPIVVVDPTWPPGIVSKSLIQPNLLNKTCCTWMNLNGKRPQSYFKWMTTLILFQMEDDLNFISNGRRPQFYLKWKMTSILFLMEDDLNFISDGRRPQLYFKWKTTSISLQMEDDLNFFSNGRCKTFFSNGSHPRYSPTSKEKTT
jgi:hypothetical protein